MIKSWYSYGTGREIAPTIYDHHDNVKRTIGFHAPPAAPRIEVMRHVPAKELKAYREALKAERDQW